MSLSEFFERFSLTVARWLTTSTTRRSASENYTNPRDVTRGAAYEVRDNEDPRAQTDRSRGRDKSAAVEGFVVERATPSSSRPSTARENKPRTCSRWTGPVEGNFAYPNSPPDRLKLTTIYGEVKSTPRDVTHPSLVSGSSSASRTRKQHQRGRARPIGLMKQLESDVRLTNAQPVPHYCNCSRGCRCWLAHHGSGVVLDSRCAINVNRRLGPIKPD